jgi:hypothetical protein
MLDVFFAVVATVLAAVLLGVALPLVYGVVRLVSPTQAYPECARLFRMVAKPE